MRTLTNNINELIEALIQQKPIACTEDGVLYLDGFWGRLWRNPEDRLISIAQGLIQAFDSFEAIPVLFDLEQPIPYQSYIQAAELVLEQLSKSQNPNTIEEIFKLLRRLAALRYRIEGANGGYETQAPDLTDNVELRQMVRQWKETQPLIPHKELTQDELERIQDTISHPTFLNLLKVNETLREQFFTWTIRDKMSPMVFIQYPAMQEKIVACALAGRIGRINGYLLSIRKVEKGEGFEKIVVLPFEGKEINILNQEAVYTFRGNYTLTIAQVFQIFADKFAQAGNLEFLAQGIINWNYLKMGWWNDQEKRHNLVDISKSGWWKQLPIFEIITLEQARERYGNHVDGKNWNVAASASRGTATLDYERTHAYLNVAIPMGKGNYAIYDFGKIANEFPTNFKEIIDMFAMNVHASVAYPDESIYYSHREHTHFSFPMNPEQAFNMMDSIRADIVIARQNNFVYQIESDNCAKWAQEKIAAGIGEENIPNLFQMHLLATEPFGPVAYIFNAIRKLPKSIRTFVLTRLHLPLGAGKGTWIEENGQKVFKSLSNHEFFETGIVYLPAFLHRQQEMGLLGRVIELFQDIIFKTVDFFDSELSPKLFNYFSKAKKARKFAGRMLIPQWEEVQNE